MPTALSINNELGQHRHEPPLALLESPELAKDCKGSKCMTATPAFCQYSGDLNGCCRSLIQAWREGSIGKHCIIEGLRINWHQCRQVLKEGLYNENKPPEGKTVPVSNQDNDLANACKQVVLLGYPLGIRAIPEVFYQSYYKLVRSVIERFGIEDNSKPSADDVFQDAFVDLHEYFSKGVSVKGRLASYIWKVTANRCIKAIRSARKEVNLTDEDQIQQGKSYSAAFVPPGVVETWEHLDHKLLSSDQANLINRIILAQWAPEGSSTAEKSSAKQLKADWQCLSQMSQADIVNLHSRVVTETKRCPSKDVVPLVADMINAGLVEQHQLAIVFAARTGMDIEQTCALIEQLNSLSKNAVYARICRIVRALRQLESEEEQ